MTVPLRERCAYSESARAPNKSVHVPKHELSLDNCDFGLWNGSKLMGRYERSQVQTPDLVIRPPRICADLENSSCAEAICGKRLECGPSSARDFSAR